MAWASSHSLDVLPAAKEHVALYLQHLTEKSNFRAATEEAIYALGWAHNLAGVASPMKSSDNTTSAKETTSKASLEKGTNYN